MMLQHIIDRIVIQGEDRETCHIPSGAPGFGAGNSVSVSNFNKAFHFSRIYRIYTSMLLKRMYQDSFVLNGR